MPLVTVIGPPLLNGPLAEKPLDTPLVGPEDTAGPDDADAPLADGTPEREASVGTETVWPRESVMPETEDRADPEAGPDAEGPTDKDEVPGKDDSPGRLDAPDDKIDSLGLEALGPETLGALDTDSDGTDAEDPAVKLARADDRPAESVSERAEAALESNEDSSGSVKDVDGEVDGPPVSEFRAVPPDGRTVPVERPDGALAPESDSDGTLAEGSPVSETETEAPDGTEALGSSDPEGAEALTPVGRLSEERPEEGAVTPVGRLALTSEGMLAEGAPDTEALGSSDPEGAETPEDGTPEPVGRLSEGALTLADRLADSDAPRSVGADTDEALSALSEGTLTEAKFVGRDCATVPEDEGRPVAESSEDRLLSSDERALARVDSPLGRLLNDEARDAESEEASTESVMGAVAEERDSEGRPVTPALLSREDRLLSSEGRALALRVSLEGRPEALRLADSVGRSDARLLSSDEMTAAAVESPLGRLLNCDRREEADAKAGSVIDALVVGRPLAPDTEALFRSEASSLLGTVLRSEARDADKDEARAESVMDPLGRPLAERPLREAPAETETETSLPLGAETPLAERLLTVAEARLLTPREAKIDEATPGSVTDKLLSRAETSLGLTPLETALERPETVVTEALDSEAEAESWADSEESTEGMAAVSVTERLLSRLERSTLVDAEMLLRPETLGAVRLSLGRPLERLRLSLGRVRLSLGRLTLALERPDALSSVGSEALLRDGPLALDGLRLSLGRLLERVRLSLGTLTLALERPDKLSSVGTEALLSETPLRLTLSEKTERPDTDSDGALNEDTPDSEEGRPDTETLGAVIDSEGTLALLRETPLSDETPLNEDTDAEGAVPVDEVPNNKLLKLLRKPVVADKLSEGTLALIVGMPLTDALTVEGRPDTAAGVSTNAVPVICPLSGCSVSVRVVVPSQGAVKVVAGSTPPPNGVAAGVMTKVDGMPLASGPTLSPGTAVMVAMVPSPPS